MSESLQSILDRLKKVQRQGNGYIACCPAHDDQNPSLSIGHGEGGRLVVHCFSGCSTDDIMQAIGLTTAALMPGRAASDNNPRSSIRTPISSVSESVRGFATAEEALASLELKHGKRTAQWMYEDASGAPVGIV